MDLNRKYADHQLAVMRAAKAPLGTKRETHLFDARSIAAEIETCQLKLGAAASCAWSAAKMEAGRLQAA